MGDLNAIYTVRRVNPITRVGQMCIGQGQTRVLLKINTAPVASRCHRVTTAQYHRRVRRAQHA